MGRVSGAQYGPPVVRVVARTHPHLQLTLTLGNQREERQDTRTIHHGAHSNRSGNVSIPSESTFCRRWCYSFQVNERGGEKFPFVSSSRGFPFFSLSLSPSFPFARCSRVQARGTASMTARTRRHSCRFAVASARWQSRGRANLFARSRAPSVRSRACPRQRA